jgi:hypothetical protein
MHKVGAAEFVMHHDIYALLRFAPNTFPPFS